jgi:hypothetical protein
MAPSAIRYPLSAIRHPQREALLPAAHLELIHRMAPLGLERGVLDVDFASPELV